MTLKELRTHRGATQTDLASRLHLQQAAVSKLETRTDLYVSMLRSFIEALGGRMEIHAVFPNESVPITGLDKSDVLGDLKNLVDQRCRIHPMPPERADDEFRVRSVSESGNVVLDKISNGQSLEVPDSPDLRSAPEDLNLLTNSCTAWKPGLVSPTPDLEVHPQLGGCSAVNVSAFRLCAQKENLHGPRSE